MMNLNETINNLRDENAELKAERDALMAQVEALKSAYQNLCSAIQDVDDCEDDSADMEDAFNKLFGLMRDGYNAAYATPQLHLNEIRAEAIEYALNQWKLCSDSNLRANLKFMADRIRAGKE